MTKENGTFAKFGTIAVLGAGLLGGSVLLACQKRGVAAALRAWSPSEATRRRCAGAVPEATVTGSAQECVRGANLVLVCAPVDQIAPTLRAVAGDLAAGALVTDVGSAKAGVCADAAEIFDAETRRRAADAVGKGAPPVPPPVFIGSHPMAGAERGGIANASADLFAGRVCILTPPAAEETLPAPDAGEASPPASPVAVLREFWRALGMRVTLLSPEEHDTIVARVSHLTHLAAAALSATLAAKPEAWRDLGGPGLRDTTRVAAGAPELWLPILAANRAEVLPALDELLATLASVRDALAAGDFPRLEAILRAAQCWRAAAQS
ncbi:MAG: prephenate dehydrogenase/arogenate dehydrogenase family protein [Puniceicoccales bacterium]|jgi:prephenate dehydrogenase|nr:prephenate dehydrogenase/arogenate dehydrogenase family protein [Puniceicoccales bacterium]